MIIINVNVDKNDSGIDRLRRASTSPYSSAARAGAGFGGAATVLASGSASASAPGLQPGAAAAPRGGFVSARAPPTMACSGTAPRAWAHEPEPGLRAPRKQTRTVASVISCARALRQNPAASTAAAGYVLGPVLVRRAAAAADCRARRQRERGPTAGTRTRAGHCPRPALLRPCPAEAGGGAAVPVVTRSRLHLCARGADRAWGRGAAVGQRARTSSPPAASRATPAATTQPWISDTASRCVHTAGSPAKSLRMRRRTRIGQP